MWVLGMRVGTVGLLRLQTLDIDSLGQAVLCLETGGGWGLGRVDGGQGLDRAQLLSVGI